MPPPAAAEVAFAQFAELLALLDELLLPHPAASTAQPSAAAMATPVFFLRTFPLRATSPRWVRDANIVAGKGKGAVFAGNPVTG
jgi:glutathione S-transferase